jgi:DNA polymerase-3 subunit gamma/tau
VALYRRYRPETFNEVIGQSQVTDPLRHALRSDNTNHAYLFSGPRGCGKTTSARILARCLNCENGPTDAPCGECPSCVELSRDGGGSLDVVEIDAASHNGVDDARELRERAVFAPARDRYKIYILDEAHMVTQQGFNALLKIVEEPPPHVKFIFATTEPEKVLTTIRSRTHHYPFRLVPSRELLDYLERLLQEEQVEAEAGVLALVVKSGGGSVRDSLSILDQLIAGSESRSIRLEDSQRLLGYTPREVVDSVLDGLNSAEPRAVFSAVAEFFSGGGDPRRFVQDLLSHLRDLIICQASPHNIDELFPGMGEQELRAKLEQSRNFEADLLSQMAELVSTTLPKLNGVTSPALHAELLASSLLSLVAAHASARGGSTHSQASAEEIVSATENFSSVEIGSPENSEFIEQEPTIGAALLTDWNLESLLGIWPNVLSDISSQKRSLWVAISTARPVELDGDVVTLGFMRRSDAEILKKPQGPGSPLPNADLLREAIEKYSGHRVRFTVTELAAASLNANLNSSDGSDSLKMSQQQDSDTPTVENAINAVASAKSESAEQDNTLASRGEPVVRQLLGGELVGEEILQSLSDGE